MTRVLGIDLGGPGGLAVIVPNGSLGSVLHWQRLGRMDLAKFRRVVEHVIEVFEVGLVATERPFTGRGDKRPRVGLAQREKQGVVRTICQERKIKLVDYQPQTIKHAITGNGRASKEQVGRAVQRMLKIPSDDEHVLDACAIGMLAMSREGGR
jgi:Holliday junction resolvasome RuvABC endonuclease subunit